MGLVSLGTIVIIAGAIIFAIPWWMGVLAVLMTVFLVVVAGRATGRPTSPRRAR